MLHVKGSLTPVNSQAVKWGIGERIATEVTRNDLTSIFNGPNSWANEEWKQGEIVADSNTESPGGRPAIRDFIARLYTFITAPGIAELDLNGEFIVTVSGTHQPVIVKAKVANQNVFYSEAMIVWNTDTTPFMEKLAGDE